MDSKINITEGSLDEVLDVLSQIPEFDQLKPNDTYASQLKGNKSLILVAKDENKPIACKLGYDRFKDGSFYTWLGGVLPAYRKTGIAKSLALTQESWARAKGYESIKLKTQNRHKAMLIFAINNGFEIVNVKPKSELQLYRIELIKTL